jgi:lipopolysaccharide export system permease protein
MRIVDRYLLRQFVWTFLVCYVSLTGLYVVFDAFTNLEEFLRYAHDRGGVLALMASHYSYRGLWFFDLTAGLLTLIAAMFTATWIQRHNEMTALMSAGIPRVRVVAPVIAAGVAVAVLAAANRELVMPHFRDELTREPKDLVGKLGRPLEAQYDNHTYVLFRGAATYGDQKRIEKPDFLLPPALSEHGKLLVAENAFYKPPSQDRPGGYLFDRVDKPKHLDQKASLSLDGKPVIITPRDAPEWLDPNQCFLVSDVSFEQLASGDAWWQYSSSPELILALRNRSLSASAKVRVGLHGRLVQPFLDVTLLLLGLPLVLRRGDRNVFLAIGLAAVLVAGFMLVVTAFEYVGANYTLISPSLAAWVPLMIFVPIAVAMSEWMWQ